MGKNEDRYDTCVKKVGAYRESHFLSNAKAQVHALKRSQALLFRR